MNRQVDLTSCDTEPIHIIGHTQPFGALVAADVHSMIITHLSANVQQYTGHPASELLGSDIGDLFGREQIELLMQRDLEPRPPQILQPWFAELRNGNGDLIRYECLPHQNGDTLIIELRSFFRASVPFLMTSPW